MKIILAIFAIACGAAFFALWDSDTPWASMRRGSADATTASASPLAPIASADSEAGDLLRIASERLDRYVSIAALIRYRIQLFETELLGSGLYQQAGQGSERRFRLELKTQVGDQITGRLQVCDGKVVWSYRELADGHQLEHLDLVRVRDAQRQAGKLPPDARVPELPTGGLPKLLEGLRQSFQTRSEEAGYLGEAPMWAVELEWKPSVLAALVPTQQARISAGEPCNFADLPQMPERVMVYLGHEDLFPRRIEFRRRDASGVGQGRAGETGAESFASMMTVEFTNIEWNQSIDPRQFIYEPGKLSVTDVTDAFLQSRGLPAVR